MLKKYFFYLLIQIIFLFCIFARSVQAVTFESLAGKVSQVIDKTEALYPLYEAKGGDIDGDGVRDTLGSLEEKYSTASKEEIAEWRARLWCGERPLLDGFGSEWLRQWIEWRTCITSGHTILAEHYMRNYLEHGQGQADKDKTATHLYLIVFHLDSFITGEGEDNLADITNSVYEGKAFNRLRDTGWTSRYLADSTGYYLAPAWAKSLDLLPRYYCTSLEKPYDFGKNCKTINLWERVREVFSGVAVKIASEWLVHSDGTLRTEYWDGDRYLRNGSYAADPNRVFNPSSNIGWYDLTGRRTMGNNLPRQEMSPHFFNWTMSGMTHAAKAVLNEGGIYPTIYNFGLEEMGYSFSIDFNNNANNNVAFNAYGYPVRSMSNGCDGAVNLSVADPLAICTGGSKEWGQYSQEHHPDQINLAYQGQHLGGVLSTLAWGNIPDSLLNNALNLYYAFKAVYFKDGDSYVDYSNGGFSEAAINKYNSSWLSPVCVQGESAFLYYKNPKGVIVKGGWSEGAAELLANTAPGFAYVISQQDQNKANEILEITDNILTPLAANGLDPEDANCGPIKKSYFARRAWQEVNMLVPYFFFKKVPYAIFPKACDINADQKINEEDIKETALRYGRESADCTNDSNTNAFDMLKVVLETKRVVPSAVSLPLPPSPIAVLADNIRWGEWSSEIDLISAGFPSEALPLDTREVFLGSNGTWFDSITKGSQYWNRFSSNYNNWSGWVKGSKALAESNYPIDGFQTRSLYQFGGNWWESITQDLTGWNRTSGDFLTLNQQTWSSVELNQGMPDSAFPPRARAVYLIDNNLLVDLRIKGGYLWYKTYSIRPSNWTKIKLSAYGFDTADIDTITVYKNPSGVWVQSYTKGNKSRFRLSQ